MQNKEMLLKKKLLPIYRTVRCHIPSERRNGKNAKFCLCTLRRHRRVWRRNSNDFLPWNVMQVSSQPHAPIALTPCKATGAHW